MNVYAVIRYGNEIEGPDGRDTVFVVRAENEKEAGEITDQVLEQEPNAVVSKFCSVIHLVGLESGTVPKGVIIGPLLGLGACDQPMKSWQRFPADGDWEIDFVRK